MSRVTKPCPGCKQTGNRRHADSVCFDCAHAIEQWNKHVAAVNLTNKQEYVCTGTATAIGGIWTWTYLSAIGSEVGRL